MTVLEWTYEPTNFFEEPFSIPHGGGYISVADGHARGEFDTTRFELGRVFRDTAQDALEAAFMAQQVQVHVRFTLGTAHMFRLESDGRRHLRLIVGTAKATMRGGQAVFIRTDAEGNIIPVSKTERGGKQNLFLQDVTGLLPGDLRLKQILQSFSTSFEDSDNLFFHLYEIRDGLCAEFGNRKKAQQAVGVSDTDWGELGRLANDEPLMEGRHRGKHIDRPNASTEQIEWARRFAQRMIEGYVAYQKKTQT